MFISKLNAFKQPVSRQLSPEGDFSSRNSVRVVIHTHLNQIPFLVSLFLPIICPSQHMPQREREVASKWERHVVLYRALR